MDKNSSASDWAKLAARFGTAKGDEVEFLNPPDTIPTGLHKLDRDYLNGGMVPGVYTVMAEPGTGKSALALQVAMNVASQGGRVLYLTAELTRNECVARAASSLSATPGSRVPAFSWSDWESMGRDEEGRKHGQDAIRQLHAICPGLVLADTLRIGDADAIDAVAQDAKRAGLQLLVVDYLQAIEPPHIEGATQFEGISSVCRIFTALAKDLHIPVLLISSMGRAAQASGPDTIGGGYGTSRIEYDAQAQMRLTKTAETFDGGCVVMLHVTKNRRGPRTFGQGIELSFDGAHNRVTDW